MEGNGGAEIVLTWGKAGLPLGGPEAGKGARGRRHALWEPEERGHPWVLNQGHVDLALVWLSVTCRNP